MSKRILIIEDDERIAHWISTYLERSGFQTTIRHDGQSGLHIAQTEQPDLIILDIMLPGLDGFSICQRLRHQNDTPIIMLTAKGDEVDRIIGLEVGADDYLAKPFNPRELLARIRAILRRQTKEVPGAPKLEEEIVELIPCNIEAIDALKNLESAGLCDRGEIKSHYVQLTDILRNYFDREYELDTVESTTHEIVSLLKSKKIDALLLKEINELLEEADLVKFAKSSPDGFTNDRFMKSSFTIVQDCHKMNEEVSDV